MTGPSRSLVVASIRANIFAFIWASFVVYDFLVSGRGALEHPSEVNLLVASLAPVAFALAVGAGFHFAQSTRASGLQDLLRTSVTGAAPLLQRAATTAVAPFVLVPILAHLGYLLLTRTLWIEWDWLVYIPYVPLHVMLGYAMGLVAGRVLGLLWLPRSLGMAMLGAALVGVVAFFSYVSLPPTQDPSDALNFGLVSVALPPDTRLSPQVILRQEAFLVGALGVLVAGHRLLASRYTRSVVIGACGVFVGVGITAASLSGPILPVAESVSPAACIGDHPIVCAVPLEARGARLLHGELGRVARSMPEAVPALVVQGSVAAGVPNATTTLRMPGNRGAAEHFAAEVVFKHAGCTAAEISNSSALRDSFEKLLIWLDRDVDSMEDGLRATLRGLTRECSE